MYWKPIYSPKDWPKHAGQLVLLTVENGCDQISVTTAFIGYGDGKWYTPNAGYRDPDSKTGELSRNFKLLAWMPLPPAYNPYEIDVRYLIRDIMQHVKTPRSTIEIVGRLIPLVEDHVIWNEWQNYFYQQWKTKRKDTANMTAQDNLDGIATRLNGELYDDISDKERNDLIHFEHNGVKYAMTKAEIAAAHAYMEREFQEEDALRQLNYFVFGYDGPDFGDNPEDAGPSEAEDLDAFEEKYELTYMDARKFKQHFVTRFNNTADCDRSENDIWHDAIEAVLNEMKDRNRAR